MFGFVVEMQLLLYMNIKWNFQQDWTTDIASITPDKCYAYATAYD